MARTNGRDLRIKRGATTIAVVNTKTININNNPVDVTGDSDEGFVTLLGRPGTRQITCDVSGFTDDDVLRDSAVTGSSLLAEHTIEWLSADGTGTVVYSITGDFYLATFSETGASDGGLEFSASLQSSGAWTKSPLVPVGKSDLLTAIQTAQGLTPGDYTPATWAVVEGALIAAQLVYANASASQGAVDNAEETLTTAIGDLELL